MSRAGARLKKSKCCFFSTKVEFLGHLIDAQGLHPTPSKTKAIMDAPSPKSVTELKSFLGLLNYYCKFLPNLSSTLHPLYCLLQKSSSWFWGPREEEAFKKAKDLLGSPRVLAHFDPSRKLVLSCDASPFGLGAVLSQVMEDGAERPISYASRSLTDAEKRYSQLDKEALAVIFGVNKFHQYLYGRPFTIYTDHKPLTYLFSPTKSLSQMSSARLQRWALTLNSYNYSITHRRGCDNGNADALSRLPISDSPSVVPIPGDVLQTMEHLSSTPITADKIKIWTSRDPHLSQVLRYVQHGWPVSVEDDLAPFARRRFELSSQDGCILWGSRVVIPPPGRALLLKELHEGHPGISRMKSLARSYIWWPGLDGDLEREGKSCLTCQVNRNNPPPAPVHPWEWPAKPWSRLHVDYAGPFMGKMFLLIVDAHTKWMDIHITNSSTSQVTIEKLCQSFSNFGLPLMIVTDNGSSFVSEEFQTFLAANGIIHRRSSPYHPATNGLAERAVQTFKHSMRKLFGPLDSRLSQFLFRYRITPHTSTEISPAEAMFGRPLRSRLDLVYPDTGRRVQTQKPEVQSQKLRTFQPGDHVLFRNFGAKYPKWISGVIQNQTGPLSYSVILADGRCVRRHVDHIISGVPETNKSDFDDVPSPSTGTISQPSTSPSVLRRSARNRHPPERYSPSRS